jgi:hypothetical protein
MQWVVEWTYLAPWLDRDHVAFTLYRARKDGQNGRSYSETISFHVRDVLASRTLTEYCRERSTGYTTAQYLQGRGWFAALAAVYPIARDDVYDRCPVEDL